jgi:hypothetical protein
LNRVGGSASQPLTRKRHRCKSLEKPESDKSCPTKNQWKHCGCLIWFALQHARTAQPNKKEGQEHNVEHFTGPDWTALVNFGVKETPKLWIANASNRNTAWKMQGNEFPITVPLLCTIPPSFLLHKRFQVFSEIIFLSSK